MRSAILALWATCLVGASGCYQSEVLGDDVTDFGGKVDDSAMVRFHTADDVWVAVVLLTDSGGQLFCQDFENADWIRLAQDHETVLIQLYSEDEYGWIGDFGDQYRKSDGRVASGVIWTTDLGGEDGREIAFSREEAIDPCLGHLLSGDNADAAHNYDHDLTAHVTWWSEGIDLRGTFTGSAAAGYIRAVDCGPVEVEWEVRDRLDAYVDGC